MSRWLFFPSPVSAVTLSFSGTVTNAGSWYADSNNFSSSPTTGVTYIKAALAGIGLRFSFANQTDRDAFETAYPSGVGEWSLEVNGETITTSSWSWNHSSGTTITDIRQNQWSPFLQNFPYTVGDSFNVTLT